MRSEHAVELHTELRAPLVVGGRVVLARVVEACAAGLVVEKARRQAGRIRFAAVAVV